jgi:hypothetical protein
LAHEPILHQTESQALGEKNLRQSQTGKQSTQ